MSKFLESRPEESFKAEWKHSQEHYKQGDIQPIEVIEDWNLNFCLGNAIKYIARAEHKGTKIADLEKAVWYLERALKHAQK